MNAGAQGRITGCGRQWAAVYTPRTTRGDEAAAAGAPQQQAQQQQRPQPGRYGRIDITGVAQPLPSGAAAALQLPDQLGVLLLRDIFCVKKRRVINGQVEVTDSFEDQPLAQLPYRPDGSKPPLQLICRRNDTWFKVAVALIDRARSAGQPPPQLYLAAAEEGDCKLFRTIGDL